MRQPANPQQRRRGYQFPDAGRLEHRAGLQSGLDRHHQGRLVRPDGVREPEEERGGGIGKIFDIGSGRNGDGLDLSAGSVASWFHSGGIIGSGAQVTGQAAASLWSGAPKFHTGGIVGGLKSRERAIIAKDDEAIFPTVRMADGSFGVRATGFTGGDIVIQANGSSGNAQKDQAHQKGMAREVKESLRALIREEMLNNSRAGGSLQRQEATETGRATCCTACPVIDNVLCLGCTLHKIHCQYQLLFFSIK
ncbi:hypothetical protein [Methylobacterium sp. Leaf112]|uniref:hypothetical protein n=1 Tax=Methylobacterium sp. Leaf112 TaxID=1736258 RepID=UPI0006FE0942|nr:hypothetical protein [Methylobacterium sp. Leaf112]KQP60534.1 hypothetical protein ASF52_09500 [Methylobacterium sp. Leaf112]